MASPSALISPGGVPPYGGSSARRDLGPTVRDHFFEKFQIPGVVVCIDGIFVTMIRPKENEEGYYCRKDCSCRSQCFAGRYLICWS
ncbi:hypothetical protein evm_002555 [Chilo suppressalis]|nr:hypothetical protein evm_002555 [Chilo suppressalis]